MKLVELILLPVEVQQEMARFNIVRNVRKKQMVELKQKTIEAIHKISEAIKGTGFFLNRFSVDTSGANMQIIEFDIREESLA